jgi:hypothetical protein
MHHRCVANRRRLSLEHLETRQVLSGLVSARIEGGVLLLEGDAGSNGISILRGAQPGQVVVAGQQSTIGPEGMTRVNGSTAPVTLNGFTAGILAQMGEGDDFIEMTDLTVHGHVVLSLGGGDDGVVMYGDVNISFNRAYPQQNGYQLGAARVTGNFIFRGGSGDDGLSMYVGDPTSAIDGNLNYYGDAGNDSVWIAGSNFAFGEGAIPADGGKPDGGFDVNGNVALNLGEGRDTINANRLRARHNVYVTDEPTAQSATINFDAFAIGNDLFIITSTGADSVFLTGGAMQGNPIFTARNVYVSTGARNDQVYIVGGAVANLDLATGQGDEGNGHFGVVISNFSATNNLFIDTGAGFDNVGLGAFYPSPLDYSGPITARNLRIVTGSGSDGLIVTNTTAVDAWFDTGVARDLAGVYDSTFDNLRVFLADGNDDLYAGGVTANILAELDGGLGNDVFIEPSPNNFKKLTRRGF